MSIQKRALPFILITAGLLLSFRHPLMGVVSPVQLDLKIEHQPFIMPAVYKVYENENALNGKYNLFKMLVTNNSNISAHNVQVSYQIPNYIDWTTLKQIPILLPGQSVVVNCFPTFPDKIVDKTTSSQEKINIKIKGTNISDIDEEFGIDIKGRNEFLYTCIPKEEIQTNADAFDNSDLLACLVTPDDPIIKYFTQKIQEKILKGEAAAVDQKEEEGVRFIKGVYTATLISHMVYSGTSGVPANYGDVSSMQQDIRLPREVVTGKTGLCIELSLLYASILAEAGLNPVIFLIPGHAYPGFIMNKHYYAIEATGIGGEGLGNRMSADEAFETGMKELQQFADNVGKDDRYKMVNIRDAINTGAEAMELKDDPYLRQKIDEIALAFESNQPVTNGTDQNSNNNPNYTGYTQYQGVVTFSYPSTWELIPDNSQNMKEIKQIIAESNNNAAITIYQFDGYNDTQQAMEALKQFTNSYTGTMQYQSSGQSNTGYSLYNGQTTYSNNSTAFWMTALKVTENGVVGIRVAAYSNTGTQYVSTLTNILNSLR